MAILTPPLGVHGSGFKFMWITLGPTARYTRLCCVRTKLKIGPACLPPLAQFAPTAPIYDIQESFFLLCLQKIHIEMTIFASMIIFGRFVL